MSTAQFGKKMRKKAASFTAGSRKERVHKIGIGVTPYVFMSLARIARATDEKITTVLHEYVESQGKVLERLAANIERCAPKERLKAPLVKERKKAPSMKSIRAFAETKKKEVKK